MFSQPIFQKLIPTGSPSRGGDVAVDVKDVNKPTELAHSFLFCSCVCSCLYGPFKCISFHRLFQQLSAFSLCSSGVIISVLSVFPKIGLLVTGLKCPVNRVVSLQDDQMWRGGRGGEMHAFDRDHRVTYAERKAHRRHVVLTKHFLF